MANVLHRVARMTANLVYELSSASLETPESKILREAELAVRAGRVTAILGPSGTGKSAVLRVLAGRGGPELLCSGTWRFKGEPLGTPDVGWFPQKKAHDPTAERLAIEALRAAPQDVLLLDEPERSFGTDGDLVRALRERREGVSVVLVTHDLGLVRSAADDVALLCAGNVVASAEAREFFDRPRSDLAARFVRQGNCWPAPTVPELPAHFRWLWPGELAGMGRPGLLRDTDEDLAAIALAGISLVVSLTEEDAPVEKLRSFGIASRHFPIRDMDVPSIGQTASLCGALSRSIEHGERVAVHCHAGLGRTGTILGAMQIWRGAKAADALVAVRAVNAGFIQNRAQELFLERFGEAMGTG